MTVGLRSGSRLCIAQRGVTHHLPQRPWLGREAPELPPDVFFEEAEWQALYCYHDKTQSPPEETPSLGEAMHRLAKLGGFIGRKGDGDPGPTPLWRGLDKLHFITETFRIFHPAQPAGP
jgi:hypothetical protein